ncbi:MAG TPA: S1 RNA-binding domain-containing protein [Gemmata sp.]|nr:S1 RNA-binding domain-containing protein [Gemmata sp.]
MSEPAATPPPENTSAPATPPASTPEAAQPQAAAASQPQGGPGGAARGGPPRPGAPRPGGPSRGFPQGNRPPRDKPLNPGGAPPVLRDFGANKPNNRELDAMIEAELAQAMAGFDVQTAVAEQESAKRPPAGATGQRKKGRVVGIHGKDVFIDVPGGRSQGVLPLNQFEGETPKIGQEVEFDVERYDGANGLLVLTREGSAQAVTDWSSIALHMIVEARVTGTNKNKTGLTVEVNGIKGFLPASQLDLYRVEDIEQFNNQRMKVEVIELDPSERNLIVSRRSILERERLV